MNTSIETAPELAELIRIEGTRYVDGRQLPVVRPLIAVSEPLELDRQICQAGLTHYVRPIHQADKPQHAELEKSPEYHLGQIVVWGPDPRLITRRWLAR